LQQKLAGRVSWDQDWNGTTFVIPAKKDWRILFFTAWLAFWVIAPLHLEVKAVRSLMENQAVDWTHLIWVVGWVFGIVFAGWSILWAVGGKEVLRLSGSQLELSSSIFGFVFQRRQTPFVQVRNLRYVPSHSDRWQEYQESNIRYGDGQKTVKFGGSMTDAEALAVIEQMLSIYPFPKKDKALEYIDRN
jgi:hypothetical protein